MMRVSSICRLTLLSLFLTACSWSNFPFLYKPDIQQGNELSPDRLAQLHVGMTRDEVNYLLGMPVLTNVLDTQEVQYVYTFKAGKGSMTEKKLLLTFESDKLVKINN